MEKFQRTQGKIQPSHQFVATINNYCGYDIYCTSPFSIILIETQIYRFE